jgi:hypothetical protein
MRHMLLFCALLLASCSEGREADLQYVSTARSLGAEWALVNEQANSGKLTGTYTQAMRKAFREGLETASSSLTQQNADYAREIRALIAEPADAAPATLRAHADRLKQIEDNLESA